MFNGVFNTSSSQSEVRAEGLTADTKERATVQHLQKNFSVSTPATGTGNSLTQQSLHHQAGRHAAIPEQQGAAGVGHGGLLLR